MLRGGNALIKPPGFAALWETETDRKEENEVCVSLLEKGNSFPVFVNGDPSVSIQ